MKLLEEGVNFGIVLDCPLSRIPSGFRDLPFKRMVEKVLGRGIFVSIAFVRESRIRDLNKQYREKDESTDVLSFQTDQILFSINNVRRKARDYGLETNDYLSYLLIHALLHLKGHLHGSKMESTERKLCKLFKIVNPQENYKTNNKNELKTHSRYRHRHVSSASGSSRTPEGSRIPQDTRRRKRRV